MSHAGSPGSPAPWRAFLETHARTVRTLEAELQERCGLQLTWYDVLVQLNEATNQSLRMHELADRVLLSRSGLTRLVDRMENAGLVARQAAEDDRRGTRVALTARGSQALQEAAPVHLNGVHRHFLRYLGDEELERLVELLSRIVRGERMVAR